MASIKISELEEVVTLSESDTLPITNEGDTKQVAISKLGDILATKEYVNKTVGELARTSDVLTKTNTTSYTPTADYHPSTKKYVDDAITSAITTALESDY